MIDYKDCRLDHNYPRFATADDDPVGLCGNCIVARSYHVQRTLGPDFVGAVDLIMDDGTVRVLNMTHGFINSGFRGIEIAYSGPDFHLPSAGRITNMVRP